MKRSTKSQQSRNAVVLDRFVEDAIEVTGRVPNGYHLNLKWDRASVDDAQPVESLTLGGTGLSNVGHGTDGTSSYELQQDAVSTLRALAAICTQLADRVADRRAHGL